VEVATTDLARVVTIDPVKAELIGPVKAAPTDPPPVALTVPVEATLVIWTAKLRTGSAVDKTVNGSKTFSAAAVIASAEEDSAVAAPGVADSGADDDKIMS
jgi:hypothetical protein